MADIVPCTYHKRPANCKPASAFAAPAVTKYISVITKANSQDTKLAYGTFWEIYTVYIHTVLNTHTHNTTRQQAKESSPF